ncbi:MAG TPA: hypothetical protein VMU75_02670 [Acidimicrobiales bacterium]|nr:hypothetical protein [Acidimicrobiales bacterium]
MNRATARSSPRHRRVRLCPQAAAALVIPVLAIMLSGCLSSGYAYFSRRNPDGTELYFKLPSRWSTFDPKQIIEASNGKLSPSQIAQIEGSGWTFAFSGAQDVSLKQLNAEGIEGNRRPTGLVIAAAISGSYRDSLSFSSLRSTFLGTDPLTATNSSMSVLSYNEFSGSGGLRGSKMVVNVPKSGLVTTIGQIVVVDPATNWIFGIEIGCRASCWGPNQGLINQILNAWTVKELRS